MYYTLGRQDNNQKENKMDKKQKLKHFEILVPTHNHMVYHADAEDEKQALDLVLSGELSVYDFIEEEIDPDSNNYIINVVEN